MPYLFAGFALSFAVVLAMSGHYGWAAFALLIAVLFYQWGRPRSDSGGEPWLSVEINVGDDD